MNVERWLKTRRVSWQKLEDLLKRVESRGLGSLDRQGLNELGRLYRASSGDLSRARVLPLGQLADVQTLSPKRLSIQEWMSASQTAFSY